MAKTKEGIMKSLKGGMSCVRLSDVECKVVDGKVFVDTNGVKRACESTPVLLTSDKWCRDRFVLI